MIHLFKVAEIFNGLPSVAAAGRGGDPECTARADQEIISGKSGLENGDGVAGRFCITQIVRAGMGNGLQGEADG